MSKSCVFSSWLVKGSLLFYLLVPSPAEAQIAPDDTLPVDSSVQTQGNTSNITGGTKAGSNLFHSFKQFSIPTGNAVYFNKAPDIQSIIIRVTGGSVSNIDGLVKANGSANLFLLNPNGFVFGPHALLDIGGSFAASTASSLNFADGKQFSTTSPQTTPLLAISVPIGLQFGQNPGRILVQGQGQGLRITANLIDTSVGLRVLPNQTLAIIGGDVALEGGTLKTAGGRIELGSVAGGSLVSLASTNKGWTLGYEGVSNFQDIKLSQQAAVDASGNGGGNIQVRGRRMSFTNGSQIEASTLGDGPGGTLNVAASHLVELTGVSADGLSSSGLFAAVYRGATGSGGNLTVETPQLTIRDGGQILTGTYGAGPAGSLVVRASDLVEVIGASSKLDSAISTLVQPRSTGTGGNLLVETGRLVVRDGAAITTTTFSQGAGGSLLVKARESVELIGTTPNGRLPSRLTARTRRTGNAGNLTIETGKLDVRDGAEVSVSSIREGSGEAGKLEVAARSIRLDNKGKLRAETESGQGGDIKLQAQDLLLLRRNSEISTNAGGTGNGGNITISTGTLTALENSDITASAIKGRGGNIQIDAKGIFRSPDSDIIASSQLGINGTIQIKTPDVDLTQGLLTLPEEPVDGTGLIAQGCAGVGEPRDSKFVVTGRGGIPENPNEMLNSDKIWTDLRLTPHPAEERPRSPSATSSTAPTPEPVVEATGWTFNSKGEVVLTAAVRNIEVPWLTRSSCYAS